MTLQELIKFTPTDAEPLSAEVDCQITAQREQMTKTGKPYLDIEIADAASKEKFKLWSDHPSFTWFRQSPAGSFVRLAGLFSRNSYGLNVDQLEARHLGEEEISLVLAGSTERQERLARDWNDLVSIVNTITDPRLLSVCLLFLNEFGERFQRAGAAREIHHARRGGLLEHTAQMMRVAHALMSVYPELNWDLIRTGVLFHDCGKLWEHDYPVAGFTTQHQLVGELLGHIPVGIELANRLWKSAAETPEFQAQGTPSPDLVKQHLLHLIASHHGQKEFGAPVTPRTPEAWALHYIDNLDARVEMMRQIYSQKSQIAPGIYDQKRPLEGHAVQPLPKWVTIENS